MKAGLIALLLSLTAALHLGAKEAITEPPAKRESWQLFEPKVLPAGKRLSLADAGKLVDGSYADQRFYLTGDFVVIAVSSDRAVLRDQRDASIARVVATYPPEIPIPPQGSKFTRDESHPFQIHDVRRRSDGFVTIFVRDTILHASSSKTAPSATPFLYDKRTIPSKKR